jgi:hypothetical protein
MNKQAQLAILQASIQLAIDQDDTELMEYLTKLLHQVKLRRCLTTPSLCQ